MVVLKHAGQHISCHCDEKGIWDLVLDHQNSAVNKFDKDLLAELAQCIRFIKETKKGLGLLIRSGKKDFVVGADITEFHSYFSSPQETLAVWLQEVHRLFCEIEDLPFPTVSVINGLCLGGGCELVQACTYRVATPAAKLGLPETKLGIYPGWGGTIRLPRIIGADNAIEWIAGGKAYPAAEAQKVGLVDFLVDAENLEKSARKFLSEACAEKLDWQKKRQEKLKPLQISSEIEKMMVFETAKSFVAAKAGKNYPAPVTAISVMQKCANLTRDEAIEHEIKGFIKVAQTDTAHNLVGLFLADQYNKRLNRKRILEKHSFKYLGVVGAGIMGGGIAYQATSSKIPTLMKDIRPEALELGVKEAAGLFGKQVKRKKLSSSEAALAMGSLSSSLSYGDFKYIDLVIEAVVEREDVKKSVYQELEEVCRENTIIASNTSTISINRLANELRRPENFCGMHFFNPVHRMPLVEIIEGEKTSKETIGKVVALAETMGKKPVVVKDCPGFLVNRVLFPYFQGFVSLLEQGIELRRIDKVMEQFGWPMGPAYLLDVIGLDTAVHATKVMASGFPERMTGAHPLMQELVAKNRLGQKTAKGFYQYIKDKKGRPKKTFDPEMIQSLKAFVKTTAQLTDEEITLRMMLPMINEAARCVEEGIVNTAMEVDLGVLYGLGFPPFRGGVLKYADNLGLSSLVKTGLEFSQYGACYEAAPLLQSMASESKTFYH